MILCCRSISGLSNVKSPVARHATIIGKHICKHNSIKHYIIQHTGNLTAWPPTPSKPAKVGGRLTAAAARCWVDLDSGAGAPRCHGLSPPADRAGTAYLLRILVSSTVIAPSPNPRPTGGGGLFRAPPLVFL